MKQMPDTHLKLIRRFYSEHAISIEGGLNTPPPSRAYLETIRLLLLWSALICPRITRASSDEAEARRHFEAAKRLYEADDFKGAAVEFATSVALHPTKNGYFNLANCYKAIHRYADALFAIDELEARFGGELSTVLRKKKDALEALIRSVVGELSIRIDPAGARVTVDDERVSPEELEKPLLLGPGEYRIEATLAGFERRAETVQVKSGEHAEVFITLKPASGRLRVDVDRAGATVRVNDVIRGTTPLEAPLRLPPDTYTVSVSLEGFDAVTREVTIQADKELALQIALLERTAPRVGDASPARPGRVRSRSRAPVVMTGVVTAVALAAASGASLGLANRAASDFDRYNDAYPDARDDRQAAAIDRRREAAYDKNRRFFKLGLGFGIGAGVLALSTAIWSVATRRSDEAPAKSAVIPIRFAGSAVAVEF